MAQPPESLVPALTLYRRGDLAGARAAAEAALAAEPGKVERAAGRRTRYRAEMAGVPPILAPWPRKMGYEM